MQLIILPLTDKGKEMKQERIKQVVELARQIEDDKQQVFVLAGILVNTDKFISREYAEQVRRWLRMTKVVQIFEEEKQDAVNEAINETRNATRQEEKTEVAEKMISDGEEIIKIMKYTGLTRKQIEEIKNNLSIIE